MGTDVATDMELFERLRARFGWGDGTTKGRVRMASMIKRTRVRRGMSTQDVADVIAYCEAEGIYPLDLGGLLRHSYEAMRWARRRKAEEEERRLRVEVDDAIAYEMTRPGSQWLDRLSRAVGAEREEVLVAWKASLS